MPPTYLIARLPAAYDVPNPREPRLLSTASFKSTVLSHEHTSSTLLPFPFGDRDAPESQEFADRLACTVERKDKDFVEELLSPEESLDRTLSGSLNGLFDPEADTAVPRTWLEGNQPVDPV